MVLLASGLTQDFQAFFSQEADGFLSVLTQDLAEHDLIT